MSEPKTQKPDAITEEVVDLAGGTPADEADEASAPVEPIAAEVVPTDEGPAEGQAVQLAGEDEDLDSEDSLTFSNGVIEKIVAISMRDVPGVIGMKGGWLNRIQDVLGASDARKGVTVEVTPDSAVRVNISVLIEYGAYAPQVFEDVKRTVVKQVTGMTGLEVAGVNLRIEDVLTPEEYAASKSEESRQDAVAEATEEDGR